MKKSKIEKTERDAELITLTIEIAVRNFEVIVETFSGIVGYLASTSLLQVGLKTDPIP